MANGMKSVFSFLANALARFFATVFSNKKSAIGFIILMVFLFFAIWGSDLFPYDISTDYANKYAPISPEHILGTDYMGRDVFTQIVVGCRNMFFLSLLTAAMTVTIGTFLGVLSGFVGGLTDKVIQMLTNLVLNIPQFPILLVLSTVFTIKDTVSFAVVLSVFSWAGLCRSVRAQIISLKERDFIQICKVMKMPSLRIILTQLIPNIYSYIIVNFVMVMRNAITASVGIMTLGLAAYDATNWGVMLYQARILGLVNNDVIAYMLKPLIVLVVFQIGTISLANGLDEVFNPRLKKL